jgi:hypothetical protein
MTMSSPLWEHPYRLTDRLPGTSSILIAFQLQSHVHCEANSFIAGHFRRRSDVP